MRDRGDTPGPHHGRKPVSDLAVRPSKVADTSFLAWLVLEPRDFPLKHLANKRGPSLSPDQFVDTLAKPFRQADVGRFHIERRSSHARVVTEQGVHSIGSRISGTGY